LWPFPPPTKDELTFLSLELRQSIDEEVSLAVCGGGAATTSGTDAVGVGVETDIYWGLILIINPPTLALAPLADEFWEVF
jgi:hypothetical protein